MFALSPNWEKEFGPISLRASTVLGQISRRDILPHKKLVARASHPGLTIGVLLTLCIRLCTAQLIHTHEHDHTCRLGCPSEPASLSNITTSVLLCMIKKNCGQATVLPRRSHLLHDLITVFSRSLQYGIGVLGFIDAFVYVQGAASFSRRNMSRPWLSVVDHAATR